MQKEKAFFREKTTNVETKSYRKIVVTNNTKSTIFLSMICFCVFFKILIIILAVVTLQTFYLGKLDLLTVYLGKLDFLSVTDFSLGSLPWGNFMVWILDMSREQ